MINDKFKLNDVMNYIVAGSTRSSNDREGSGGRYFKSNYVMAGGESKMPSIYS